MIYELKEEFYDIIEGIFSIHSMSGQDAEKFVDITDLSGWFPTEDGYALWIRIKRANNK